jgi:hypothetical protein
MLFFFEYLKKPTSKHSYNQLKQKYEFTEADVVEHANNPSTLGPRPAWAT